MRPQLTRQPVQIALAVILAAAPEAALGGGVGALIWAALGLLVFLIVPPVRRKWAEGPAVYIPPRAAPAARGRLLGPARLAADQERASLRRGPGPVGPGCAAPPWFAKTTGTPWAEGRRAPACLAMSWPEAPCKDRRATDRRTWGGYRPIRAQLRRGQTRCWAPRA